MTVKDVTSDYLNEDGWPVSPVSAQKKWRQHPSSMDKDPGTGVTTRYPGEVFADMFLGWTFNTWGSGSMGAMRKNLMTTNMVEWLK